MKNKNILIIGWLGFIGIPITKELLNTNYITIINNLSTGNINNLTNPNHENLKILQ